MKEKEYNLDHYMWRRSSFKPKRYIEMFPIKFGVASGCMDMLVDIMRHSDAY